MREYSKISPQIWINDKGRKIKKLGLPAQLLSFYLQTNPHANMIGIYYLPIALIAHEIGLSVNEATNALKALCEIQFCTYDYTSEYVWVQDMIKDQIGSNLKSNDNRIKAINELYDSLPDLVFKEDFFEKFHFEFHIENKKNYQQPLEAPLKPLQSQEKEQDKEQKKEKDNILSDESDLDSNFEENFSSSKSTLTTQATEVLEFLNEKTERSYRPVEANLKLTIARLRSGATVAQCFQVIAKKKREWKSDSKMSEYLRPATLFNAIKFEQYVGELVTKYAEEQHNEC